VRVFIDGAVVVVGKQTVRQAAWLATSQVQARPGGKPGGPTRRKLVVEVLSHAR
jgi:hypothetical protein